MQARESSAIHGDFHFSVHVAQQFLLEGYVLAQVQAFTPADWICPCTSFSRMPFFSMPVSYRWKMLTPAFVRPRGP